MAGRPFGYWAITMLGGEIVQYEPVSKIGGAGTFTRSPQRFPSIASGIELIDDDGETLIDDDGETLIDDGA